MSGTSRRDFVKLALLSSFLAATPFWIDSRGRAAAASNSPNIVIVVFDTLSAKHMSTYGYARETTPNLTRFASRATVFHRHYAGGNFTSSGTSSILTGASPWSQRAFNFEGTVSEEFERANLFRVFGDAGYRRMVYTHNWLVVQLLNQFRSDIDYWKPLRDLCLSDTEVADRFFPKDHDVAITSERIMSIRTPQGTASLFLSMLDRAIQTRDSRDRLARYQSLYPRGLPTNNETAVFILEDAIDWIQTQLGQADGPLLGYFHLLPPHDPYNPRKEFIGRFDGDNYAEAAKPTHVLGNSIRERALDLARRQYDEFLAYADSEFGRLFDFMQQHGILDSSYLVFTSDHGEMLERGTKGHLNPLLYEPITRVPLLISSPGQTTRVDVTNPTSALDLLPTLAHLAGQPIPKWCEGEVLPILGGNPSTERSVYTVEAKSNAKQAPLTKSTVSMVKDKYKLISYQGYDQGYEDLYELYDLKDDPEELNNQYSASSSLGSELRVELTAALEKANRRLGGA